MGYYVDKEDKEFDPRDIKDLFSDSKWDMVEEDKEERKILFQKDDEVCEVLYEKGTVLTTVNFPKNGSYKDRNMLIFERVDWKGLKTKARDGLKTNVGWDVKFPDSGKGFKGKGKGKWGKGYDDYKGKGKGKWGYDDWRPRYDDYKGGKGGYDDRDRGRRDRSRSRGRDSYGGRDRSRGRDRYDDRRGGYDDYYKGKGKGKWGW